jgi:hypothetical protein
MNPLRQREQFATWLAASVEGRATWRSGKLLSSLKEPTSHSPFGDCG